MNVLLAVDASSHAKHAVQMVKHLSGVVKLSILFVVDVPALKHAYLSSACTEKDFEGYREEMANLSRHVLHESWDDVVLQFSSWGGLAKSGHLCLMLGADL